MFKRLGHVLLIVALLAATGSHWAVLQSVAWTTMLADNLRNGSLTEAVQRTFDGEHPCSLCKQITAGKKSEKKAEFPTVLKKFEFVSECAPFVFSAPDDFRLLPDRNFTVRDLAHKPPVPPPRPLFG